MMAAIDGAPSLSHNQRIELIMAIDKKTIMLRNVTFLLLVLSWF